MAAAAAWSQDLAEVEPGPLLGVGDALPDLDRALEVAQRLAVGEDALRGLTRLDRGGERARQVVGGVVVHGELGRDAAGRQLAEQPRVELERLGDRGVQRRPLARQQVVVDGLADERVAEGVRAVVAGDQHVAGHGLAGGGHQLVGRDGLLHRLEQAVLEGALGDGGDAHDGLGGAGQALDAGEQRVAQRLGQRGAPSLAAASSSSV